MENLGSSEMKNLLKVMKSELKTLQLCINKEKELEQLRIKLTERDEEVETLKGFISVCTAENDKYQIDNEVLRDSIYGLEKLITSLEEQVENVKANQSVTITIN